MKERILELINTVYRDPSNDGKVYLENAYLVLREVPFATRQVLLHFPGGPELALSILDMDGIVAVYLKMRGLNLPPDLIELACTEPTPMYDLVVLSRLQSESPIVAPDWLPGEEGQERSCSRCGRNLRHSAEWYGDLCPECADNTDGKWVCCRCSRIWDFEGMGGSKTDPHCCGSPCKRIKDDGS